MLYLWAFLFWLGLLALAILFGAARQFVLAPALGDALARALGTLALCAVDFYLILLFVDKMGVREAGPLVRLGVFLTVLTLLFEFGFGRYRGFSWEWLLADYNVFKGRLWSLVPLTTLFGPLLARRWLP